MVKVPQGTLHVNPCDKISACDTLTDPAGPSSCCVQTNFTGGSTTVSCGTMHRCTDFVHTSHTSPALKTRPSRMLFAGAVGHHSFTTDLEDPDLQIGMIQSFGTSCGYILEPAKKLQVSIAFECDHDQPDPGILT